MSVSHLRNPGLPAHLREDEKRLLTYSDRLVQLVQVFFNKIDNKFLVFFVIEEVKVVN